MTTLTGETFAAFKIERTFQFVLQAQNPFVYNTTATKSVSASFSRLATALFCSIAITWTEHSVEMYSKNLSSCVHFCAGNQHFQNFSANNKSIF